MSSSPITVLCVEDDLQFLELTATFLRQKGDEFTVLTETSASDALDRLAEESIDCVVSDYEMPGLDGLEFLEAIRETHPDLPFILFTGKGSEDVAEDAIQAGVTGYIQKESGTSHYAVLANRIENAVSQYRAERRANSIAEEYELVAETATDAFWAVDLRTESVSMSEGIAQFGYSPERAYDLAWFFENVHPDDRDCLRAFHDSLLAREPEVFDELDGDRGTFSDEYRFRRADGSYAHVQGRGIIVFDADTPVKMVGTMTDISESREREQEITRLKDRFQAVTEHSLDVITVLDETGTVQYESPAIERLLGYRQDELVGESPFDYIHPDDRDRAWETFSEIVTQSATDTGKAEYRFEHADGSWVWLETVGSNRTDSSVNGYVLTSRDITERKEREQELRETTQRLEKFADVLSHDLRSPLAVAQGNLELARTESDSGYLDEVDDALTRVNAIIEDVLTLAREDDALTITADVSLSTVAEKAWSNVETEQASLELAETTGPLSADAAQLCRVLENLFRNSVEHGGEGIAIRLGSLEDGAGFYVEDDGPGIQGDATRLFDWGYSTDARGTGFGLAIVDQIVDAHGWTISATDGDGGGARFEIGTSDQPNKRLQQRH